MQLLHDGTPAHRATATTAYLNANNVNAVDSPPPPPKSPDLNIIENIWDELNRRVRRTGAIPTTLNQLRAKSLRVEQSPSELRSALCDLMRRRCLVVVNSAGDIPATKFTLTWTRLQDLT